MTEIVNSLFADYLTQPTTEEQQQTTITPIAQQTTSPTMLTSQPVMQYQTLQPVMTDTTQEEEQTPVFDPSTIDLEALNNIDFSTLSLEDLANLSQFTSYELGDFTGMGTAMPTNPADYYTRSLDFLNTVASGNTADKVNRRDDIYNNFFTQQNQYTYEGTPADFRTEVGLSDTFAVYDDPASMINQQTVQDAYNILSTAENPLTALSEYYGFDITPTVNEGANYTNAAKYGTDAQRMAEFQSIVEPILQRSIPYITATQGLNYTDALEYAYTHDPMLAALYNQYGVDLYRQTDDGSTYIYDPIAGQEIRTLEVKDAKLSDYLPALAAVGLSFIPGLQGAIGGALGATGSTATALGSAITSGITTAVSGGDLSDVLRSMATAGLLKYGASELASNVDLQDTLNKVGEEFGFGTTVEQVGGNFVPAALTEQGITGGIFTGGLAQVGAEAGKGLGDVLAAVGDAIANPSTWTPKDLGDSNIILNLVSEASKNEELATTLGTTVDVLRELAQTAYTVYEEAGETPPAIDFGFDINIDPTQTEPITVDEEAATATVGLETPAVTEETITGDNVVAAQLDEAIQNETDENVKQGLIDEYETLTGQDYGSVDYVPSEEPPTAEPVQPQDVLGDTTGGMLTGDTTQPPADTTEQPTTETTQPTVDTTQPTTDAFNAQQNAQTILTHAVMNRGEYKEEYDYDNDGKVTANDALLALKTGMSREDLFGVVESIFGSTVEDVSAALDSIGGLEDQITVGNELVGTLTEERDTLSGQVTTLEGQLADAQAAADAAAEAGDANAAELQAEADAIRADLDMANADLADANETITTLETELGTTQEELATTQEDLATAQEERDAALTSVVDLTALLDTTKEDVKAKQTEIDDLTTTTATLEEEVTTLTTDLETANTTIADLEEQLQTAKDTNADNVADLEAALEEAKTNATDLEDQLDTKTTELEEANTTIETLNGELDTANASIEELTGQLETTQGDLDAANASIEDLTDKLGTAEAANEELQNALDTANEEKATVEGELETAKETNTDLTNRLGDANTEIGKLNEQLGTANEDLATLKDEYAAAVVANQENVDELEQAIKDKEDEIAGLEGDIDGLNKTIDDLNKEIADNEEEISGLEGSLADALATITGLEGDLATSRAETETAIAEGEAAAVAAGEAGYESGYGTGYGTGYGEGEGVGYGKGFGQGMLSGGANQPVSTRPLPKMPEVKYGAPLASLFGTTDYMQQLLERLRA